MDILKAIQISKFLELGIRSPPRTRTRTASKPGFDLILHQFGSNGEYFRGCLDI